jgi:hypothetical protein
MQRNVERVANCSLLLTDRLGALNKHNTKQDPERMLSNCTGLKEKLVKAEGIFTVTLERDPGDDPQNDQGHVIKLKQSWKATQIQNLGSIIFHSSPCS